MLKRFAVVALVALCLTLVSGIAFSATMNVIIWGKYFNPAIFDDFEKQFNCTVKITEVTSYDEVFNLLKTKPNTFDLLVTGELAYPDLIKGNMLEPLNKALIPNIKNLDPLFKGLSFDPNNTYTLPYHYIYVGIAYNKNKVTAAEAATLATYFEAPAKLKGRVTTFPNAQIMVGMAMKYMGKSFNSTDPKDLNTVKALLTSFKNNVTPEGKSLQRGIYDYLFVDLVGGKADISIGYVAGSVLAALSNNKNIGVILPKEGGNIGTDDMSVVKGAPNKDLAFKFINYMYDPKVAAKSVEVLRNPIPVKGVKELLPAELQKDPILFPSMDIVKKLEFPAPLTAAQQAAIEKVWADVFGK